MSESNPEPPADEIIAVADTTSEFVERTRYKRLYEARQTAAESLRETSVARSGAQRHGDVNAYEQANTHARESVQAYVLEAEDLFRRTDVGTELWESKVLGPIPATRFVSPRAKTDTLTDLQFVNRPPDVEMSGGEPDQRQIAIRGVRGFVNFEEPTAIITTEQQMNRRGSAVKEQDQRVELDTPVELSRAAFRATNELLAEVGVLSELGGDDYHAEEPGA